MHFCNSCENMLYIKLNEADGNDLVYYCRKCGETNDTVNNKNICVLKTEFITNEKGYQFDINKYIKYDPTLPRTKQIKCPNIDCSSNKDAKNEVIYFRYDDSNMKYVYICSFCDKIWKTNDY